MFNPKEYIFGVFLSNSNVRMTFVSLYSAKIIV